MNIHKVNGRTIQTSYEYPPIPLRNFDWCATLDGYDPTPLEPGDPYRGGPTGWGATEQEAIDDLLTMLEDE